MISGRRFGRSARLGFSALVVGAASAVANLGHVPAAARAPVVRVGALAQVELPGTGQRYGIASIVHAAATWWAAGSFVDAAGEHRPGLWSSSDAIDWRQIATVAITPYGEISELYSVAATTDGVVALGMATGGAHGNPRTVSWVLAGDGRLHEVAAAFELYNGPRQISVRTVVAGPAGWVIFGSRNNRNNRLGATAWTSSTGDDFTIHDDVPALSSQPGEQNLGLDVTPTVSGLLAVGERFLADGRGADTDAIAWTSPDGLSWSRFQPAGLDLGGPQAQRSQRVSGAGSRVLIAGTETNAHRTRFVAWVSNDGFSWRRSVVTALGQSDDALSAVTVARNTDRLDLVGAKVGDTLRLAVSSGGSWRPVALPAARPSGVRAVLSAASAGTVLLVGAAGLQGGGLWRAPVDVR